MRKVENYEFDVLPIFMYNTISFDGDEVLDIDVVNDPQYNIYTKDFGKDTDYALAWEIDGRIAGIAWTRIFEESDNSFGFVDNKTPELTLSVLAGYNELAIGRDLLEVLGNEIRLLGYKQISVSLQTSNEHLDLYVRLGYEEISKVDNRILFIKKLS